MKKNRYRFWMLMVDGCGAPKTQHWSYAAAKKEAERLAAHTQKDVFLMEATEFVREAPPKPPVIWKNTVEGY